MVGVQEASSLYVARAMFRASTNSAVPSSCPVPAKKLVAEIMSCTHIKRAETVDVRHRLGNLSMMEVAMQEVKA